MKAPITPTQAWAVIAESAGWNAKELPVLPDHPEPRTMKWTAAEIEAIQAYGQQCAAQARELALEEAKLIAKLCCSADDSAFGDGYNTAAFNIERDIEKLKAGK